MLTSFATQTTSSDEIPTVSRAMRHDTPRSSRQWLDYFHQNLAVLRPIPWERGAEITDAERDAICPSLQAWQLGETSEGRHLRAAAFRHGLRHHDPDFLPAVEHFILEEQRHGELLGRFLDLAGVPRKQKDWGDSLFRGARYCLRNMESWTTPVIMVEVLALVYYNGLRRATNSAVLSAICRQILADEIPHIRYQCERLASIFRARPTPLLLSDHAGASHFLPAGCAAGVGRAPASVRRRLLVAALLARGVGPHGPGMAADGTPAL